MLHYACLFAHDQPSTLESDWDIDHGHVDGWAEWFEQMPLLFLYLIGDARHLPQIAPCTINGGSEAPACLMAPMAEVRQRWLALHEHMQRREPKLPDDALARWEQMHAVITATTRQWLILDCSMLIDDALGTPQMEAFLQKLRQTCEAWGELSGPEAGDLPPVLQPLLDEKAGAWGWWNPAVIERIYAVEEQPYEAWPSWLREHYVPVREDRSWREEVQAYLVYPSDPSGDEEPPDEYGDRCAPVGLVTPYGRWLVHPDEGARWVDFDAGYLCLHQRGEWREGIPSGLKDFNGQWVVPISAGYFNLFPVTKTLATGWRTPRFDEDSLSQLLRWPEGQPLFDDIRSARLHDDGWVHVTHADEMQSVLDAVTGEPLFAARYMYIRDFHKKLRLAVVEQIVPDQSSPGERRHVSGVVHESGRQIVPCDYAFIHRAYKEDPPKLLHGRQLLAITPDGRPHFYSVDGKLLAAPDCNIKPWTWTPMVKSNQLIAFDGEGMDARVVLVSLSDYSMVYTGETRGDCVDVMRQRMGGRRSE